MPLRPDPSGQWFERPFFYFCIWTVVCTVAVATFYIGVFRKDNDFQNHYDLGREFMQGTPYGMGTDKGLSCTHYPLGRLMLDGIFSVLPYRFSRMLNWIAGALGLIISLKLWNRMAQTRRPVSDSVAFAGAALAFIIGLGWFIRDMDDAGQQLLLVTMLTLAAWTLVHGNAWASGLWLGLAVAYKATPLLFLPLLLYKRKWLAAAVMTVTLVFLNGVAPALFVGWDKNIEGNRLFFAKARQIRQVSSEDPTVNGVEPAIHLNRSLRIALARYLMTFEPGHVLFLGHPDDAPRIDEQTDQARAHPLFKQPLNISPKRASQIITGILIAMALVLAVRYRRPWGDAPDQADITPEWTAVMLLCAILSPLCWGQHMVLLIPALFLVVREQLATRGSTCRMALIWVVFGLINLPQREIMGRNLWLIVHSYKVETIASLLILWLVLSIPSHGLWKQPDRDIQTHMDV
jgi:hypothetical protein